MHKFFVTSRMCSEIGDLFHFIHIAPKACGAHDCDMVAFRRRVPARGVSIVAAFVFVAILSAVAVGVESTLPGGNPASQTAAPGGIGSDTVGSQQATARAELAKKCETAIKEAKIAATTKRTAKPAEKATDDCVGAIPDASVPAKYRCVGKSAQVDIASDKGGIKVTTQPNPNMPPGKCATLACTPNATGNTLNSVLTLGGNMGVTKKEFKCFTANMDGIDKTAILTQSLNTSTFDAYTGTGVNGVKISSGIDSRSLEILNNAYGVKPADSSLTLPATSPTDDQILKMALANPDQAALEASRQVTEDAFKQNPDLGDAKVLIPEGGDKGDTSNPSLDRSPSDPTATRDCYDGGRTCYPAGPKDAGYLENNGYKCGKNDAGDTECVKGSVTQQCPPGSTGTPPNNCIRVGQQTFQDPNTGRTSSSNSSSGPLDSFLKGLANAFKPTPPMPPPAAAQQCSTDPNAYAQQQQQYQQQLQQYNYQLQLYQYQQQQQNQYYGGNAPTMPLPAQPVACTPSTQGQCSMQPQRPNPNNCTTGSWQPTYSGACITNWQCIPTGGGTPKATLSCSPEVADVGQQIAITYGCSSGIASSSSFTVTTQPGGSATTTVANPPAGTNTATYSLACVDGAKTSGAQCSVQVSRPTIILVANPKTVPPNGTSLLSWLTTGMTSCVISSPDQEDFTERNSSNTSVAGAATTSPITTSAMFLLHCETVAGGTKEATTTVSVAE
ncbi:hypothetical protein HY971_02595 [Candidatus Kaiserbacteria bacterium]|nr:hypothetical protein [Candidatus Kaiserbacteria bacterium]